MQTRRLTHSLVVVVVLALTGLGLSCKTHPPLTQAQVQTIVTDAGFGIEVGCSALWLDAQTCTLARRVLGDATVAVTAAPDGWQAVAKAILVRENTALPPDSRLHPYFDAAIVLL